MLYEGIRKGEPRWWVEYVDDVSGRADEDLRMWGGGRNTEGIASAIEQWAIERTKAKDIELTERGAGGLFHKATQLLLRPKP